MALGDGEGRLSWLCRQGQELRVERIILELGQRRNAYVLVLELSEDA